MNINDELTKRAVAFTRRFRLFGVPAVETKEERGHGLYVRAGRVGKW